jgi:hypothetical protein
LVQKSAYIYELTNIATAGRDSAGVHSCIQDRHEGKETNRYHIPGIIQGSVFKECREPVVRDCKIYFIKSERLALCKFGENKDNKKGCAKAQ